MNKSHLAYLNLGSNIQPETNLPKALKLLSQQGKIQGISSVWESRPVGTEGQNYLNLCASFESPFEEDELKEAIIHPIESQLGRRRSADKYAPRPIDVDIVLFDDQPAGDHIWDLGYVIVPLAELYPEYRNPKTGESIYEIATRLRRDVWLETRQGVIG